MRLAKETLVLAADDNQKNTFQECRSHHSEVQNNLTHSAEIPQNQTSSEEDQIQMKSLEGFGIGKSNDRQSLQHCLEGKSVQFLTVRMHLAQGIAIA
jgi:hypothetical protein